MTTEEEYNACSEIENCHYAFWSKGSKCFRTHVDCKHNPKYVGDFKAREITLLQFEIFYNRQLTGGEI